MTLITHANPAACDRPGTKVRSVGHLVRVAAKSWPASEIVFPGERATYAELGERVTAMAHLIRAAGARRGDHVGVLLNPCVDMIATLFGIARAGCVIVPINDRLKATEVRHLVQHADLRMIVTTDAVSAHTDFPVLIRDALPSLTTNGDTPSGDRVAPLDAPELRRIVLLGNGTSSAHFTRMRELEDELQALPIAEIFNAEHALRLDDLAYIMYTSGTSAAAKGCMIPHSNVIAQGRALADHRYGLGPADSFWCPLPLFHNGGLATLTACLSSGANFVHCGHFDPDVALRQLEEAHCTHAIPAFETIWLPILDHPRFPEADLSALRITLNAGSQARLKQFQARLPQVAQLANYGSTECTGHFSMTLPTDPLDISLTTCGHPLPGMEARVVSPKTGVDRAAGVEGEILVRGTMRFRGYYKAPEYTARAIDTDGWFHTGDLGRLDVNGRIAFTGRLKDMLKVGGENVAATEVEAFLLTHPAVHIAVVVGAPDAIYTEVPVAFIQIRPGSSVTEAALIDYCLGQIATFKVPRYIRFIDHWPMSGTKIQKYVLQQQIAEELAAHGISAAPRLNSNNSG